MSESENIKNLKTPLTKSDVQDLKAGEIVQISGKVFTARDKAYKRVLKFFEKGKEIPVDLKNGVVYHCGPLTKSTEKGWKVVSAGPTTSARMDSIQVDFIKKTGVKAIVGKGGVGKEVASELPSLNAVYLSFTGGAAALAAQAIKSVEKVVWKDLSIVEAIWVLNMENFGPLTVGIDTKGNNLYLRN